MSNSEISIFDEPVVGVVTVGYYQNKASEFSHSVSNDMAVWFYSTTFDTWFKEEEVNFS